MMASININTGGTSGEPQVVFDRQYLPAGARHPNAQHFCRRHTPPHDQGGKPSNAADRIHVVVNWFDELRRLLPDRN